jgi:prepilin signal peptidase PulO-like enzyme (type II secretory pathway)
MLYLILFGASSDLYSFLGLYEIWDLDLMTASNSMTYPMSWLLVKDAFL